MKRRVTQKDVALAAGVHHTTVSMVFRNHPSIPEATREQIRKIAEKLGYTHDPMLSALAAYRTSQRPVAFHGTLAWLTNSSEGFDWKTSPHFTVYFNAIRQRAREHGFSIEEFDIATPGQSVKRTASILRARNVSGLLLCPQPKAHTVIEFPWEDFSAVTFGYTLEKPKLHAIVAGFYRYMLQTTAEVRRRGYRRMGLVLNFADDQRYDHNVLASYLVSEFLHPSALSIPPYLENYRENPDALRTWIAKYRPDVIVSQDWRVLNVLKKFGIKLPQDMGLACSGIPPDVAGLSGVREDCALIGKVATDLIVAMIQRGERGVPDKPQRILVEGDWVDGGTLKKQI